MPEPPGRLSAVLLGLAGVGGVAAAGARATSSRPGAPALSGLEAAPLADEANQTALAANADALGGVIERFRGQAADPLPMARPRTTSVMLELRNWRSTCNNRMSVAQLDPDPPGNPSRDHHP